MSIKTNILFRQVDNSPLIIFRMVFGLLIFLEAWGAIATGWVYRAFVEPQYTFPFLNFSWLEPLPGYGMYAYYLIMGIAGLMVMVGYYYRWGIGIYTIMWAGVYFMQKTHYNNHYYLLLLLCLLMWLVPAHAYKSLDAKRNPDIRSNTCSQWCLWVFVAQITIVYTYAAIAKIYPDWLAARPIALWFRAKSDYPMIGGFLQKEWLQYGVAFGGIAFDLLISPALMWKRTRTYAFFISIFFHLFNSIVFQVGIFPYMGMGWAVFFFEPEKIKKIFFSKKTSLVQPIETETPTAKNTLLIYGLTIYLILQLALPLRHHLIPGNVFWTEEGHRLSWRMMLRAKYGSVYFTVKNNDLEKTWRVRPNEYLTQRQSLAVATKPDMCWQFVQILKRDFACRGFTNISIFAHSSVSLNGHPMQPLYKADVDLANVKWQYFKHADWVTDQKH